ncbi:MAG: tRNA preQ1(34) S-adenosylmethionine ribosyltransferase-isomerase QueA [Nitrospirales bacterium]|nr:tRNA preQ1(34) S-adenosylmethionine ribosyltransferase-isomerase QueA [Nitrospirales bacterium]
MQLTDFDFPFDPSLIAQHPMNPRDQARMLVVPRESGAYTHTQVVDLPTWLQAGDVLVVNDTKVVPVRLQGFKSPSGGRVEMILVREHGERGWEVLLKGRVSVGQVIDLGCDAVATVVERSRTQTLVKITSQWPIPELLARIGTMPLPPYIKRLPTTEDHQDYQTLFAKEEGAIAAPTAGLHFTPGLLEALTARGIQLAMVTLHVGPGTFRPVTAPDIHQHQMDMEWYDMPESTAMLINQAKAERRRVVAVGTTAVRSIESASVGRGNVLAQAGNTKLFITPGYQFKVVDVLLTNFHLPRTTLLMLVSAFAGYSQVYKAYEEAILERYRFYSYGDAMLLY